MLKCVSAANKAIFYEKVTFFLDTKLVTVLVTCYQKAISYERVTASLVTKVLPQVGNRAGICGFFGSCYHR
jgi:hypothetical protein